MQLGLPPRAGESWQISTHQQLFAAVEVAAQLSAKVSVGYLKVLAQVAVVCHQGQVAVVGDVCELVVFALHVGHVHVVGGGADIFVSEGEETES